MADYALLLAKSMRGISNLNMARSQSFLGKVNDRLRASARFSKREQAARKRQLSKN
jgi:hypothetical protein